MGPKPPLVVMLSLLFLIIGSLYYLFATWIVKSSSTLFSLGLSDSWVSMAGIILSGLAILYSIFLLK